MCTCYIGRSYCCHCTAACALACLLIHLLAQHTQSAHTHCGPFWAYSSFHLIFQRERASERERERVLAWVRGVCTYIKYNRLKIVEPLRWTIIARFEWWMNKIIIRRWHLSCMHARMRVLVYVFIRFEFRKYNTISRHYSYPELIPLLMMALCICSLQMICSRWITMKCKSISSIKSILLDATNQIVKSYTFNRKRTIFVNFWLCGWLWYAVNSAFIKLFILMCVQLFLDSKRYILSEW